MINRWIAVKLHKTGLPRVKTSQVPDAKKPFKWNRHVLLNSYWKFHAAKIDCFHLQATHFWSSSCASSKSSAKQPHQVFVATCGYMFNWWNFLSSHVDPISTRKPVMEFAVQLGCFTKKKLTAACTSLCSIWLNDESELPCPHRALKEIGSQGHCTP